MERDGNGDRCGHPMRNRRCSFLVENIVTHDHELVTAEARDGVIRPDRLAQTVGYDAEYLIASSVSVCVVEHLEPVKVQKAHSDTAAVSFGTCECALNAIA